MKDERTPKKQQLEEDLARVKQQIEDMEIKRTPV